MASPSAKYSKSASSVTRAMANETNAVEPDSTRPTTIGINTAAVTTRFQVIEKDSPENTQAPSHHIERNKSRTRNLIDALNSPFSVIRAKRPKVPLGRKGSAFSDICIHHG